MSVTVYVEGGGRNNQDTRARCKEGFSEYCRKVSLPGHRPKVVACGSREEAFKRFRTAVTTGANAASVLLVDSEGPVDQATSEAYLRERERWDFSTLPGNHVFLMVQAMEAWFLADRATLASYYGQGFRGASLPGQERDVELIRKEDLVPSLSNATRETRTKGTYHKTRHGFELLARIDPAKIEERSPHAAAFHRFLRATAV